VRKHIRGYNMKRGACYTNFGRGLVVRCTSTKETSEGHAAFEVICRLPGYTEGWDVYSLTFSAVWFPLTDEEVAYAVLTGELPANIVFAEYA
jgi:hypothetical protein